MAGATGSIKCGDLLPEDLLPSQEGLRSMEFQFLKE